MIRNYILTALRNIKREKLYTSMNIAGLAMGIGCALVIFKIIKHELSYNEYHSNYDQIYRIVKEEYLSTGTAFESGVPHPTGEAMRVDFPGVTAGLIDYQYGCQVTVTASNGNVNRFWEDDGLAFAEPDVFKILDFNIIAGDRTDPVTHPRSLVITASLARKYFDLKDNNLEQAIGKSIQIENALNATVSAVMADPPLATDLPLKIIGHYKSQSYVNPYFYEGTNWNSTSSSTHCYVLLPKGMSPETINEQFPDFLNKHIYEDFAETEKYFLQHISEMHYDDRFEIYTERQVNMKMLWGLGVIGIFLIVTACINFINLSTAQAVKRSKEIGVRKTLGSSKIQLIAQYLSETLLITIFASFLALIISELLFLHLEEVIGYKLTLELLKDGQTLFFLIAVIIITGLVSGFYPAWVMSRMNPVLALKRTFNSKSSSGLMSLRRVLVIIQFAISQMLIIGTIIIVYQLEYFRSKDLGFDKEAIVLTGIPDNDINKLKRFKDGLKANPKVSMVSYSLSAPMGHSNSQSNIRHPSFDEDADYAGNFKYVDGDYFGLFDLEIIAGRSLTESDSSNKIVINERLARLMGHTEVRTAIGDKLNKKLSVVGVVEDFHTKSLRKDLDYVVMVNNPGAFYEAAIKLKVAGNDMEDFKNFEQYMNQEWDKVFPEYIFDYEFYDKQLARRYDKEEKISDLFKLFAIIAIFIGCLGLYGLVAYMVNQKTKEIGVRKVLGATIWNILSIFSKEMLGLVLLAFGIAAPVGYVVMSNWLEAYTYRIEMSPKVFALSIVVSLIIALLTIGYKSINASLTNPVDSLKDE